MKTKKTQGATTKQTKKSKAAVNDYKAEIQKSRHLINTNMVLLDEYLYRSSNILHYMYEEALRSAMRVDSVTKTRNMIATAQEQLKQAQEQLKKVYDHVNPKAEAARKQLKQNNKNK